MGCITSKNGQSDHELSGQSTQSSNVNSSPSKNAHIALANREELGYNFITKFLSRLDADTKVVIFRLISIKGLLPGSVIGNIDPYVEMRLTPGDGVCGDQFQRSSVKSNQLNPVWAPAERFQFVAGDKDASSIKISVYTNNFGKNTPLGDTIIKLNKYSNSEGQRKNAKLVDPTTGKQNSEIIFEISVMTVIEACCIQENNVFEYQRWVPGKLGWGSTRAVKLEQGHFFNTDPGKYGTADGLKFKDSLEELVGPVPDGWDIQTHWYSIATDTDADGWHYALDFKSKVWSEEVHETLVVRRRCWRRILSAAPDRKSFRMKANPIVDSEE